VIDPLLDVAPDAVVTVERGGCVKLVNQAAERLLQAGRSDLAGRTLADLIGVHATAVATATDPLRAFANLPDGRRLPVQITVTRPQNGSGHLVLWIRDASAEAERDAESARLRKVFESAEVVGRMGSWEWRPQSNELVWSDNMYRIYGYEPREIEPSPERVFELVHPDDLDRVTHVFDQLGAVGQLLPLEYRIILRDRGLRYLRAMLAIAEERDGRPHRLTGTVQDLTEQRRAERQIAAHVAVSQALSEWTSVERGAPRLLRGLAEALEFSIGVLWVPLGDVLVARAFWHAGILHAEAFEAATRDRAMPMGRGLPGWVWKTGEPLSVSVTGKGSKYLRREAASRAGMHSAAALPALHGGEVLAVLEFLTTDDRVLAERLTRVLAGVGHEIGRFLSSRRGEFDLPRLTPREIEVLRLAAQGRSVREIAQALVVSPSTVKTHLENIYGKLDVSDRAAAVASALRAGEIR
jgi:PAS domain S-box-containing protein